MSESPEVPLPAEPATPGWSLLAVLPIEPGTLPAWEAADPRMGVRLVGYEGVAALLCPAAAAGSERDPLHVTARHWEVHRALLVGDVVPAPAGVVFASEDEVTRFLTESYAPLRGALARVAGRWEFRLHVDVVEPAFPKPKALDLATHIYAELRRFAGAAVPTAPLGQRVLSAAFLVPRSASNAFRERVDNLSGLNSALELELTGPWPAYDFVSMHG